MKIVVVNGSARKGNTWAAIKALIENQEPADVEIIDATTVNMIPCKGCEACQMHKGCVSKDDTNAIVDKLIAADLIVFATPVYWWGVSAQLKLVIDKCYCKAAQLKNKKVGVIVVGAAATDGVQYRIIREQFECIQNCLSWDILFHKSYSAGGKDDLRNNPEAMAELKALLVE